MSVFTNFVNCLMSFSAITDLMVSRIQSEAKQSESVRGAGGGAIVVEVVPATKDRHDPPRVVNATLGAIDGWLGICYQNGRVTPSRAYDLLPFQSRYIEEDGEIVDCESVAYGKIATLKRIRLDNPEEYSSFAATDLPGGADCGYASYRGAVVFVIRDEKGNNLMEIYVAVSGSPFDDEDWALAMKARGVLEETLVAQFGCQMIGAEELKPPQQ